MYKYLDPLETTLQELPPSLCRIMRPKRPETTVHSPEPRCQYRRVFYTCMLTEKSATSADLVDSACCLCEAPGALLTSAGLGIGEEPTMWASSSQVFSRQAEYAAEGRSVCIVNDVLLRPRHDCDICIPCFRV